MEPSGLVYLIPLHGGIWHLCVDLQSEYETKLKKYTRINKVDIDYVADITEFSVPKFVCYKLITSYVI